MSQDLKVTVRSAHLHQCDHGSRLTFLVSFLAYCYKVTLKQRTRVARSRAYSTRPCGTILIMQMVDVHLPTTGRADPHPCRYTIPEADLKLCCRRLHLEFRPSPPKIHKPDFLENSRLPCSATLSRDHVIQLLTPLPDLE